MNDNLEIQIQTCASDIARARETKLVEQEFVRRSSNTNNAIKTKIENLR